MPDFVPVLVAAVLSLLILLLIFGGYIFYPSEQSIKYGSRTIDLGENFEIVYNVGEEVLGNMEGRISRGIISGEDKMIEFNVERYSEIQEATIRVSISDSNYYGNMIILLNGQEIYNGAPKGDKMITVDPSIFERGNVLEVKTGSSSWKIWAPTVYDFTLDMDILYEGRKTQSFDFELSNEEIVNLEYARLLVFGTREGTGELIINVNGDDVFSGYPTVQTNFATDQLEVGTNKIEFMTEPNTKYDITSAKLILFF